jgi:hypothetical protein
MTSGVGLAKTGFGTSIGKNRLFSWRRSNGGSVRRTCEYGISKRRSKETTLEKEGYEETKAGRRLKEYAKWKKKEVTN